MTADTKAGTIADWDTYWTGSADAAAYANEGVNHAEIATFWYQFFCETRKRYLEPHVADIASGSGAVIAAAELAFDGQLPSVECIDSSAAAIRKLRERYPSVSGQQADARKLPMRDGSVDLATSQFGVEYAGLDAVDEMDRVLAPGGQLALIIHHRDGSIYRECAASLDAVQRLQQAQFLPLAINLFKHGFAATRGADPQPYQQAAAKIRPAFSALDAILAEHGKHVAGGTVVKLGDDVERINSRLAHHEATEVISWLQTMEIELEAYAGRMLSMCQSAIDESQFYDLVRRLDQNQHRMLRAEPFQPNDQALPIAWVLVSEKPLAI